MKNFILDMKIYYTKYIKYLKKLTKRKENKMICIINGKKYNTEKANVIGFHDNGLDSSHFLYSSEMLYITESKEYFVQIRGTYVNRSCSNFKNLDLSGKRLVPLDQDEAKKWTEYNCSDTTYENFFGCAE